MSFGIINNYIITATNCINNRDHPLIAKIEQVRIGLRLKTSQLPFKFFVHAGLSRHHSCTHWVTKTILCSRQCISFSDFRVVGKSAIVIQTPV